MDITLVMLVIASSLVYGYIGSRSGKPERLPDGSIKIRFVKMFAILGALFGVVIPCAIAWALIKWGWDSPSDLFMALGLAVLFGLSGAFLLLVYSRIYVIVGGNGIETRTLRGKVLFITWEDIESLSFSPRLVSFTFKGRNGEKLEISGGMTGMQQFVRELQERTPPSVHENACNDYARWRKLPL